MILQAFISYGSIHIVYAKVSALQLESTSLVFFIATLSHSEPH